ncbi:MAG TPA: glycosyltransferase [Candidatus Limnocylindrales bacterium]|nr:glycosyltransferase [Candidatus Limnocylindrales bacterium]
MQQPALVTGAHAPFLPTRVLSVDIDAPLPSALDEVARDGVAYERASVLVRVHSQPVGLVAFDLSQGTFSRERLAEAIDTALGDRIRRHLAADGLPVAWRSTAEARETENDRQPAALLPRCLAARAAALQDAPSVTVVIPSVDRPEALRACLEAVLAQSLPAFEIVVVDNAPGESGAKQVVDLLDPGSRTLRYEPESRRGASRARNRGLAAASGGIVAFIDGDARPDRDWLAAVVATMAAPLEGGQLPTCVTGPILPDDLASAPQQWLEEWGGFAKGFERRVFDRRKHTTGSPLYPFAAGTFGSGANMTFRASALRRLGAFDVALGPGTPARGGEDLAAFVEVVTSGGTIVYEPAAIVWHRHHETEGQFRATIRAYGTGLVAYLTRHASRHPADGLRMAFAMPAALAYFFRSGSPRNRGRSARFPSGLWRDEVAGMLQGPFAYALGRAAARGSRRSGARR